MARDAQSLLKKPKKETSESAGGMRWLLTYADMITLMLALFVILFAMGSINHVKYRAVANAMGSGFSGEYAINGPPNGGGTGRVHVLTRNEFEREARDLQRYLASSGMQGVAHVRVDRRGLVVTLVADRAYYDVASAALRPEAQRLVSHLDDFLRRSGNFVRVEGNTDNVPIATAQYPSNWELSTARSVNVVRYMIERDHLSPERLAAAGCGQFRPIAANATAEGRQRNRRIDIIVLPAITTADRTRP